MPRLRREFQNGPLLNLELSGHQGCVIFCKPSAEGSHNGIAAVLKTAARKGMQVRVLSPPPFLFNNLPQYKNLSTFRSSGHLARFWRAFGNRWSGTKRQRLLVQGINRGPKTLWHRVSVTSSHLQRGVAQQ